MTQPKENQQQYGSVLTILGENAELNGKLKNKQITFTHMAIGDANDEYVQPNRNQTVLVNELARIPVNAVDVYQPTPDSVPMLKVEAVLPDDVNDLVIRELAAVATFDGNTYFHAVGNCARIYVPKPVNNGNVNTPVTLEMIFVITSVEPIIEIDPLVVQASRAYVNDKDKLNSESDTDTIQLIGTLLSLIGQTISNQTALYITDINKKFKISPTPPNGSVIESIDVEKNKVFFSGTAEPYDLKKIVSMTADEKEHFKKSAIGAITPAAPLVFDMHSDALKCRGWVVGESGGIASAELTSSIQKGDKSIQISSNIFKDDQLITYVGDDGEYYSARVKTAGLTCVLYDKIEFDCSIGNGVFNFYSNSTHPNMYGYYCIADYALRQKAQSIVKSNLSLTYTKIKGTTVADVNSLDEYSNPGSSEYPAISIVTSELGGGIDTSPLNVFSGGGDIEMFINTYGTKVRIYLYENDGVYPHTFYEETIVTDGVEKIIIPYTRKPDSRVNLRLTQPDGDPSKFDYIFKVATRTESFIKSLDYGVHVLLGDSWFAQNHIEERLKVRLPNAEIINKGIGGQTSANLFSRIDDDVFPFNPDFTWVMCGTNDYALGVDASGFYLWMNKTISKLRTFGSNVLLFTPSVGSINDGYYARSKSLYLEHDYRERDIQTTNFETQVVSFIGKIPPNSEGFLASLGRTQDSVYVIEAFAAGINKITFGYGTGMAQPTMDVVERSGNSIIQGLNVPKSDDTSRYLNIGGKNETESELTASGFARIRYYPSKT